MLSSSVAQQGQKCGPKWEAKSWGNFRDVLAYPNGAQKRGKHCLFPVGFETMLFLTVFECLSGSDALKKNGFSSSFEY